MSRHVNDIFGKFDVDFPHGPERMPCTSTWPRLPSWLPLGKTKGTGPLVPFLEAKRLRRSKSGYVKKNLHS